MVDASDFLSSFGGGLPDNATGAQIKAQREMAAQMMQPGQLAQVGPYQSGGGWAGAMANAVRQAIGAKMMMGAGNPEQAQLNAARTGGLPYGMGGAQPAAAQGQGQPQVAAPSSALDMTASLETGRTGAEGLGSIAPDRPDANGVPSHSYGRLGLNSLPGNSAWHFAQEYGPQLGLRGKPGTPEFDQSWKEIASNPQTAPVLAAAEEHFYNKNFAKPSQGILAQAGIPSEIAQNPSVSSFFADRTVQHGAGNVAQDLPVIQQAWQQSGGDPAKFLQGMTQHDSNPEFLKKRFAGYLGQNPENMQGLVNRSVNRLQGSMQLAATGAPGAQPGMPPQQAPGAQPGMPPQQAPQQNIYPQMATDQQLHALMTNPTVMNNPQLMEHVIKQAEAKQASLMPQPMRDPSGNQYLVNPRAGVQNWEMPAAGVARLPVQGKPEIEKFKTDISGVGSVERPAYYTQGPNGMQLQRMPVMPPPQGTPQGGVPDVTPRPQPTGAGGGFQPTAAQSGPSNPLGNGYIPNSAPFGQLPGASGAGAMPDMDTAGMGELADWAQRRQANSQYMNKSAEELATSRTSIMSKAVEEGNGALDKLRDLAVIQHFYSQPHVAGGPLAEYELPMRSVIRQVLGQNIEKEVPATEVVNKFKTALAYEATRAFSNRPAVIELLGQMKVQPGTEMSDQAARIVANLLQQDARLKIGLGDLAMEKTDPSEFYAAKRQYYRDHPLVSPLTGEPLSEKVQTAAQVGTETNPETAHGIAGQALPFIRQWTEPKERAPQAQPAAPQSSPYAREDIEQELKRRGLMMP